MSSSDIRSILERLSVVEGKTTPVSVKHGLNQQQKGVPQLPALFKPKDISPTLSKKPYQAHPMDGYMVGENALAEAMQEVEEDMLSKVKKDLTSYLDKLEKAIQVDGDLKNKAVDDIEDKNPAKASKQTKYHYGDTDIEETDVNPTDDEQLGPDVSMDSEAGHAAELQGQQTLDAPQPPIAPIAEAPVKSYPMADGPAFECYGNERDGFEIRRNGKSLPSRFQNLDHAEMAMKLFQKRREQAQAAAQNQDYIEER
jgi:hypothetical protein